MRFHFIMVVWGESFCDLFLDVCLPSLLSPNNLPAFPYRKDSVFVIYTDSRSRPRIEQSEMYARLTQFMATRISLMDQYLGPNPFETFQICHRQAIVGANAEDAALCFLAPDTVWSDGTFRQLARRAASGVRAVMIPGLRLCRESFVPVIEEVRRESGDGTIALSSRSLTEIALRHLHPITVSFFWDYRPVNFWTAHLYWWVEPDGMLARCFHMHPLMIYPEIRSEFSESIDGDYIAAACRTPGSIYVVQDSDEMLGFEISPLLHCIGALRRLRSKTLDVATFASRYTNAQHRQFVRYPIRIHAGDLSPRWEALERSTGRQVERVLQLARVLEKFK